MNLETFRWKRFYWNLEKNEVCPPKVDGHCAVELLGDFIVCGGIGTRKQNMMDVFRLSLSSMKWSKLDCSGDVPSARKLHSGVVFGQVVVVFGGKYKKDYFNDVFELDVKNLKWKKMIVSNAPKARCGHSAVLDDDKMLIFGGMDAEGNYLNDLHSIDLTSYKSEWIQCTGDIPNGVERHSAVLRGDCMYVYGGWSFAGAVNELYELNLGNLTTTNLYKIDTFVWRRCTGPSSLKSGVRFGHSANLSFDGKSMIVFGGKNTAWEGTNEVIALLWGISFF